MLIRSFAQFRRVNESIDASVIEGSSDYKTWIPHLYEIYSSVRSLLGDLSKKEVKSTKDAIGNYLGNTCEVLGLEINSNKFPQAFQYGFGELAEHIGDGDEGYLIEWYEGILSEIDVLRSELLRLAPDSEREGKKPWQWGEGQWPIDSSIRTRKINLVDLYEMYKRFRSMDIGAIERINDAIVDIRDNSNPKSDIKTEVLSFSYPESLEESKRCNIIFVMRILSPVYGQYGEAKVDKDWKGIYTQDIKNIKNTLSNMKPSFVGMSVLEKDVCVETPYWELGHRADYYLIRFKL